MTQMLVMFDTAIGPCGLVWGEAGLVALGLPEEDAARTRARLARRWPEAVEATPTPEIEAAITRIRALLQGERDDLMDLPLDWSAVAEFDRPVLAICRAIPPGETLTYGEIARRLGDPSLSRGVGQALGRNPFPIVVPCHRVLGADGKAGGFSGGSGVETKLKMLTIERARTGAAPTLFDDDPAFAVRAAPKR
ncbi:MAG TPA: methylated-DNA--[protein]-cysteine S-methyltransferase [Caulobacteraceae bacterium]|nr:methylated-DNA--[protein]-cysteine S-methyltransferase [Caulobacteraceae bacterium]